VLKERHYVLVDLLVRADEQVLGDKVATCQLVVLRVLPQLPLVLFDLAQIVVILRLCHVVHVPRLRRCHVHIALSHCHRMQQSVVLLELTEILLLVIRVHDR